MLNAHVMLLSKIKSWAIRNAMIGLANLGKVSAWKIIQFLHIFYSAAGNSLALVIQDGEYASKKILSPEKGDFL